MGVTITGSQAPHVDPLCPNKQGLKRKNPAGLGLGFWHTAEFWLPDLDSNQGPAD